MILVEGSDAGGLEYLLCNSDVVNLVWESNDGEAGNVLVNFCYMWVL